MNHLPKIDIESSQVLSIGVIALSFMQNDRSRQSPWLVVDTVADTDETVAAPVKFYRFVNSFFDG